MREETNEPFRFYCLRSLRPKLSFVEDGMDGISSAVTFQNTVFSFKKKEKLTIAFLLIAK